jgi:hypothetical protein
MSDYPMPLAVDIILTPGLDTIAKGVRVCVKGPNNDAPLSEKTSIDIYINLFIILPLGWKAFVSFPSIVLLPTPPNPVAYSLLTPTPSVCSHKE